MLIEFKIITDTFLSVILMQWPVSPYGMINFQKKILRSQFNIPYIYLYMFRYVANIFRLDANTINDGLRG